MRDRTLTPRPLPPLRSTSQALPADDPGGPTLHLLKVPAHGVAAAVSLLKRLFRSFEGHLSMRLWNGDGLRLGRCAPGDGKPPFTLIVRNAGAISAMVPGFDRLRYMAACALEFESGEIGVYQLLATKRTTGLTALPLTPRHLYPTPNALEGETT